MAKASEVRNSKKSSEKPFGRPSDNETVEILIPEGAESGKIPADNQYIGRCLGFVQEESKSSGNPMLTWTFTMEEGDFMGMDFTLWTSLTANAMFKLADTLTALGIKWEPGVPLNLSSKEVKNKLVRMDIVDDNYEGRERSKLRGILPHPDGAGTMGDTKSGFKVPKKVEEEDEEDEEEVRPRRGRKPSARDEDEDEDEEEETPKRRKKAAREEEDEDEEEEQPKKKKGWFAPDDEDDEEENERPTRKSAKTAKRSRL